MKRSCIILVIFWVILCVNTHAQSKKIHVSIFGDSLSYSFKINTYNKLEGKDEKDIVEYINKLETQEIHLLSAELVQFKEKMQLDDWMYYQLIRKVAEQIAPKSINYITYTIYKWCLLRSSGYDAMLTYQKDKILFYVNCEENIYNIPIRLENGKQYVCLNYHDYGDINFYEEKFNIVTTNIPYSNKSFTYNVKSIPGKELNASEKRLQFNYNNTEYQFKIKLNPDVMAYFRNYPTTDYETHFNIPLSKETYNSLIPSLKRHVKGLSIKSGVDFLMHFTRYAFLFKPDTEIFGKEKRFSPELTLLSESSDCEDRVSLFYFLVKELYDLPMIVMVYPKHVSIGVHFNNNYGKTVDYNGRKFSICDPTPQEINLEIGEALPSLKNEKYQIAFAYEPKQK